MTSIILSFPINEFINLSHDRHTEFDSVLQAGDLMHFTTVHQAKKIYYLEYFESLGYELIKFSSFIFFFNGSVPLVASSSLTSSLLTVS